MVVASSIKLLGLGSLMCAGAVALAGDGPERASTRTNMPVSPMVRTLPPAEYPSTEGHKTGECVYDNFRKLDDFGTPASQKDLAYPFYAEAADDFVLSGDPANGCFLDDIWTSVTFFNTLSGPAQNPRGCRTRCGD